MSSFVCETLFYGSQIEVCTI